MKRINQLSINLINQIAAGEVIERPASVVKELVENAIDAGATKIEVSISNDCRNIRIADNGSGIHPEDIDLAFSKHATSKILNENDLWNISTLGFRGEALASIISIAKVTCTTRTKDFEYGTKVESQNSEVKKSQTGCAVGTIMEVNELFYNQPARLKFLKTTKTEFLYIQELMQSIAISHPNIAFVLKNNGSPILSTTANSDLLTRISEIYSASFIDSLKEVQKNDELSGLKISGYVSIPSYTRSSKKSIYTFINSRIVRCPIILKSIDLAYKNMLPSGKYPFVVINLNINPEDIDVNAHPTKKEVRYKNPNQIFNFIQSSIDLALTNSSYKNEEKSYYDNETVLPFLSQTEQLKEDEDTVFISNPKETIVMPHIFPIKKEVQQKIEIDFESTQITGNTEKIIGQFKNTYILIEKENGLEIVDQHIADERYLYEKLKQNKTASSQLLLISDIIDLEATDVDLLTQAKDKLNQFGYQIETLSSTQIIFRKIPQILSHVKLQNILTELLENIRGDFDKLEEKIIITTSCKAAVKAGEKLSIWQMEELIKKWRATKHPYSCPHGRPISRIIDLKEIASFFLRT